MRLETPPHKEDFLHRLLSQIPEKKKKKREPKGMSIFQLQMREDEEHLGRGTKEREVVPPLNSSAPSSLCYLDGIADTLFYRGSST